MQAQFSVTSSPAVNVYTSDGTAQLIIVQNNGTGYARYTLGGKTSGALDAPTASTGARLAPGGMIPIVTNPGKDGFMGRIDVIAESASTTIDVVTY